MSKSRVWACSSWGQSCSPPVPGHRHRAEPVGVVRNIGLQRGERLSGRAGPRRAAALRRQAGDLLGHPVPAAGVLRRQRQPDRIGHRDRPDDRRPAWPDAADRELGLRHDHRGRHGRQVRHHRQRPEHHDRPRQAGRHDPVLPGRPVVRGRQGQSRRHQRAGRPVRQDDRRRDGHDGGRLPQRHRRLQGSGPLAPSASRTARRRSRQGVPEGQRRARWRCRAARSTPTSPTRRWPATTRCSSPTSSSCRA